MGVGWVYFYIFNMVWAGLLNEKMVCGLRDLKPPSNLPEFHHIPECSERKHSLFYLSLRFLEFSFSVFFLELLCIIASWSLKSSAFRLLPTCRWIDLAHSLMAPWSGSHLSLEFPGMFDLTDYSLLELLWLPWFCPFSLSFHSPFLTLFPQSPTSQLHVGSSQILPRLFFLS